MQNIADKLSPTGLWSAYDHIEGLRGKTPLIRYGLVHQDGYNVEIYVKMDTLNPGGSFKDRGSEYNIDEAVKNGVLKPGDTVVTASAGNHAKGVAKAAKEHGLKAIIYMSVDAPKSKIKGTERLGAEIRLVAGDYHKAAEKAKEFSLRTGTYYVPAYEDPNVILGQSTIATEAMLQLRPFRIRPDFFVSPFGGGGLANGIGYALRHFDKTGMFAYDGYGKTIRNFAVQAENFGTMARSFKAGHVVKYINRGETIADGIRVPGASKQMLSLSERHVDGIFTATEAEIEKAIWEVYNSKLITGLQQKPFRQLREEHGFKSNHRKGVAKMNVLEGAAATAFACAFSDNKLPYDEMADRIHPRKTIVGVVIASGNNIDRSLLEKILHRHDGRASTMQ